MTDPKCLGTPPHVPPEPGRLTNILTNSYVVGPEGGTFDLTDNLSVSISIAPCSVDEPVRFTYGLSKQNYGSGNTEGASDFISFLTIPARLPGNSGYANLHGRATIIWHAPPAPEHAKIWTMGLTGFYEVPTTVDGSDVSATTSLEHYLGFAVGE